MSEKLRNRLIKIVNRYNQYSDKEYNLYMDRPVTLADKKKQIYYSEMMNEMSKRFSKELKLGKRFRLDLYNTEDVEEFVDAWMPME